MLQKRYYLNQVTLYRFTRTPMVDELLKRMGQIISTHPSRNGFYAIRGALILAATHQKGWTLILDDRFVDLPTIDLRQTGKLYQFGYAPYIDLVDCPEKNPQLLS